MQPGTYLAFELRGINKNSLETGGGVGAVDASDVLTDDDLCSVSGLYALKEADTRWPVYTFSLVEPSLPKK